MVSEGIKPPNKFAEKVGAEIRKTGLSFGEIFRRWDTNASGFVSIEELTAGLLGLPALQGRITREDIVGLMKFMEEGGVVNNRISVLEFLSGVAPRDFAIHMNIAMCKQLLVHVWNHGDQLRALLIHYDRQFSNHVKPKEFEDCLTQMNSMLHRPLNTYEIKAVTEIAAQGQPTVDYEAFMKGLRIFDHQ